MFQKPSFPKAALALALGGLSGFAAADLWANLRIKALPDLPETDEDPNLIHDLLLYLERPELRERDGVTLDEPYLLRAVTPAKAIIDGRFDCLDFRMQTLLRLQYAYGDTIRSISPATAQLIEDAFLGAKYWMTEPGEDSVCFWSENHQLLYAVAEYLAGQYWPDRIFTNDGADGREHMARGRRRIGYWMKQRFTYGYSEFNSTNYYLYNVGPASNFIEFAAPEDAPLATRMKMCLDLLLYDVATGMQDFTFTAPTGRAYVYNMTGSSGDRVRLLTDVLWGLRDDALDSTHSMMVNFYAMFRQGLYDFPAALRAIALDQTPRVLRSSHGLNTSELPEHQFIGHEDWQIMRQWSMEAFTNPEVIRNTVTYLEKNRMFSNKFVNYFKIVNGKFLRRPRTLRRVSEISHPMPNGIAIQRANLYLCKAPGVTLSCVQRYHPGSFGAQQFLQTANFGGKAVAFTTHPAREESEQTVGGYPGYWAGYGRAPHIVQHEGVQLLLFRIPRLPGFLELYRVPQFTHTYLPEAYFDEVTVSGRFAFARQGDAFLGLVGGAELQYLPHSPVSAKAFRNGLEEYPEMHFDLIQEGGRPYWIYEISSEKRESFAAFQSRLQQNPVCYDEGGSLCYQSGGKTYATEFGGDFFVDGAAQPLEYGRYESPYCTAGRGARDYIFSCGGHTLRLNYDACVREVSE
ncbi:MAG: hypothetical protein LBJ11_02760 [Oscillospiraceae bacterium]|jgi:hypothetical protein|nr:hypothetical protein [Oscillospiraceae bacterium]